MPMVGSGLFDTEDLGEIPMQTPATQSPKYAWSRKNLFAIFHQ